MSGKLKGAHIAKISFIQDRCWCCLSLATLAAFHFVFRLPQVVCRSRRLNSWWQTLVQARSRVETVRRACAHFSSAGITVPSI
jgi:hypothetical protein